MSKFGSYTALTGATVAADDLILLKDTSATATKKLPFSDVLNAALLVSTTAMIVASSVLSVGPNLATNPAFAVDYSAASGATGLKITSAAAASGVALAVVSSGTNENLTVDAKGSGTITFNATGTGRVITKRATSVDIASATALVVGANGTTNPVLTIDSATASVATGVKITGAAAASGVALVVTSSGTDESVTIDAKGAGTITLNGTATGKVILGPTTLQFPSAGILADTNGNELLKFTATVSSAVNELTLTNSATGNPVLLAATGGDTNVGVSIDGKGSGKIILNGTGTGNVRVATDLELTSAKSIVDANGNEIIKTAATVSSAVNEFTITNSATGNPVLIAATGGDTNVSVQIDAKGSGTIALNTTGTGNVTTPRPIVITSASANAFAVGRQGTTNPGFLIDASTSTNVTGVKITPAAAAAGCDVSVISSGTDENLTINAKGAGTISLNPTGTGNVITTRPIVVTSASANALAVGRQGTTNPGFLIDASTSTNVTGIKITPAAAAAGCDVSVISSGTNENLTINAKGSGTIDLNPTGTGNVLSARGILSRNATAGIGYATGAGGAVTQATSRTTGVTVNTVTGAITLVSAAGSATPASFTVTNSAVAATDVVIVNQKSGTDLYNIHVTAVGAGSFRITSYTTGGTTTEQPVFNFSVIKGVAA